jgi:3-phenylpropionate/trans-cinnamate dioxygenase ferredoxin subunit
VTWLRIGTAGDLPPGGRRVLHLLGRAYEIVRDADGGWSALELACRHQGADLSGAARQGSTVTCPRHGWRYDLATGACLTDPASPLRRPRLKLEGGSLWLEPPRLFEGPPGVDPDNC